MTAAMPDAWLSFDDAERRDAEKVAELEAAAARASATFDFVSATAMIAEADDLRETWDQPRVMFASFAEMSAELAALVPDLRPKPWTLAERLPHRPVRFVHRATDRVGGAGYGRSALINQHRPCSSDLPPDEPRQGFPLQGRACAMGASEMGVYRRRHIFPWRTVVRSLARTTSAPSGAPRWWERVGLPPQLPLRSRERKVTLDQIKVGPRRVNVRPRGTEGDRPPARWQRYPSERAALLSRLSDPSRRHTTEGEIA